MFRNADVNDLLNRVRSIQHLSGGLSLLGWDQETLMPPGGAASRAAALGELTAVVHGMQIGTEMRDALSKAEDVAAQEEDLRAAYDVQAYHLELRVDPERERLEGSVIIELLVTVPTLEVVRLDLGKHLGQ